MSDHGLAVHLHTGILVLSLITVLVCVAIRLIIYLYPRWGLVKDIFSDWDFTKNIWEKRKSIFKAFDYATAVCIAFGLGGLVIGIITGGEATNWDFDAVEMRAKLIFSVYALLFYSIAFTLRVGFKKMWDKAGLVAIYAITIFLGFFFIFIDAAVGGIMVYHESIAEGMLIWMEDIGFFRLFGLENLLGAIF